MVWVRRLLAVLLSGFFVWVFGLTFLALAGFWTPRGSVPGLGKADAEALAAPYEDLIARRDDALRERFVDGVDVTNIAATFEQMRGVIPPEPPEDRRLLQWLATSGDGKRLGGVHEQDYADRVLRFETDLYRPDEASPWRIVNFHVRSATRQELAANKFSLIGKPIHVVVIVLATVAALLFTLLTVLACLLLNDVKRRWLWLLFTLVGVTTLRVDMHGAWAFLAISVQLFSGSMFWSGSAFQPWVFSVSVPVGALMFWTQRIRRKKTLQAQATEA